MSRAKNNQIRKALCEAMTSEHTSYKSTKRFLKSLPTYAPHVIQGPGENAGIVDIGGGWALALRIESHNHPSFINPAQGAATGVGGILRDIFTMGARPIGLLDILRFGTNKKSQRLLEGVVRGIADYGNCVGVPVVGGDVYFDKTYNNNCLVNVCAFGLVRKKNIIYGNALTPGSDLIYAGARTGRDGIGGATMSSRTLNVLEESTVQEGDPFLEKLLLEACCELAETSWVEGMQDMGAAGLLCSTTEVALRGQEKTGRKLGVKVLLYKVPLKASGMSPQEILLSESQERMLIVGKRKHRREILSVFKKWDLEACVIGRVTPGGLYTIVYDDERGKRKVLASQFHEVLPDIEEDWPLSEWKSQGSPHVKAQTQVLDAIWHQYDWMVGTRTLKGPNSAGKYAVLDVPECNKKIAVTWSSDEGRADIHPCEGVRYGFDKCYKRMKAIGARPLAVTNCLNFGHPKDSMGAFAECVEALADRCKKFRVPVIGGNVSLYNAHKNRSIKPTPVLVMVGVMNRKRSG